jgi:hypothetical protein
MLLQEKSSNTMSEELPSEFLHLSSLGVCLAPAVLQKMGTGCRCGGTLRSRAAAYCRYSSNHSE